ncbi:hypothetical protein L6164_024734 [Bauhinia variegata]|uniref:Uncharacterized protein n=1 Tax=Bauhinia variegata TaxID=167791 RepID=A0ACB9LZZ8_BAUVA|nr:hypothetical protein L6164_024734 [Bauhinia variegata]
MIVADSARKLLGIQTEAAASFKALAPVKNQCAGALRVYEDLSELNLPEMCDISFPNGKDDLMNFEISNYYVGGKFLL